jgi:hypothetical protein
MKYVMAVAAASIWAAFPANAEEVGVGVGISPAGPGVTVGSDRRDRDVDRDRGRTVIKERAPRDRTIVKERDSVPDSPIMINRGRDRDRD